MTTPFSKPVKGIQATCIYYYVLKYVLNFNKYNYSDYNLVLKNEKRKDIQCCLANKMGASLFSIISK